MLILVLAALSFLLGVMLATLTSWSIPGWGLFLATGLLWWKPRVGIVGLAFLAGFLRLELWRSQIPTEVKFGPTSLIGTLEEDWGQKEGESTWLLSTEQGMVLVQLSAYEPLSWGQTVQVEGVLESTDSFTDNLSYLHYLERHRVWLVMDSARAEILGPAPWNFLGVLSRLSQSLSARLQVLLPEPEASFAVGLLLGKRQNMDQDLQDAFQAVGLTHIVAISGSNIALVVILFFTLFSFLPFHRRLAFSAIGVVTFVLLVGPSAAVVRAGLMGVLSLVGLYSGRKSQAYFGLLWSAVLMVLWNPLVLTYDVGFQLSFASTFGILTLTPILEKVFPQRLWMRDELILTLAAQLMTLPFIIFYFGRISWITPLANLVVAPLIPLAMGSSALALLFGTPAAALAWTFLMLIEKVALLCAAIPGVQWELTVSPSLFIFCLVFSALSLLSFYKSKWARAFLRECEGLPSKALNSPFEKHETR
jgi:competence protein ComEC